MSSGVTKSIADALRAAEADGALPVEDVLIVIREHVEAHPEALEELFPGRLLVVRKMTPKERAKIMIAAAVTNRRAAAQERYKVIAPHIDKLIEQDPDITVRAIAKSLDDAGIKPLRAQKWSPASVVLVMQKAGIRE